MRHPSSSPRTRSNASRRRGTKQAPTTWATGRSVRGCIATRSAAPSFIRPARSTIRFTTARWKSSVWPTSACGRRATSSGEQMSRHLASMILGLALCGCAGQQWVRQDATPQQADKDTVDCQRWATNEASLRAGSLYGPSYNGPYYRGRGTTRSDMTLDPYGDGQLEEARLADLCMRAKGYELAPSK